MRVSDAFPSNYLKAVDLQGRTVMATIDRYTIEDIGDDRKPVIYFVDKEKGLVLNKTNANEIAFVYGDDMDEWAGKKIELFSMMVQFQGRNTPGLRVRVPRQQAARPTNGNGHQRPLPPKEATTQDWGDRSPPPATEQPLDDDIPF